MKTPGGNKKWKRMLTEGVLAPLGMPYVHARSFFRKGFGVKGSVSGRLQDNPFVSSLMSVGGLAGGGIVFYKIGGIMGGLAGFAAMIPAYGATGLGVLGAIGAGACLTGGIHGLFKVARNAFERHNLLYGPEPVVVAENRLPAAPVEPGPAIGASDEFERAARKQDPTTQEKIDKLEKSLKIRPRPSPGGDSAP